MFYVQHRCANYVQNTYIFLIKNNHRFCGQEYVHKTWKIGEQNSYVKPGKNYVQITYDGATYIIKKSGISSF